MADKLRPLPRGRAGGTVRPAYASSGCDGRMITVACVKHGAQRLVHLAARDRGQRLDFVGGRVAVEKAGGQRAGDVLHIFQILNHLAVELVFAQREQLLVRALAPQPGDLVKQQRAHTLGLGRLPREQE